VYHGSVEAFAQRHSYQQRLPHLLPKAWTGTTIDVYTQYYVRAMRVSVVVVIVVVVVVVVVVVTAACARREACNRA